MERVLKRVGLSKRTISDAKAPPEPECSSKGRRRRRSKSRRRVAAHSQETRKTRGLFNIDWDSVRDCKSCKSRALTKRFCSKKCDNELYRSNSFKFERFVRGNDEVSTLGKKISLCEDYCLPLDHLNKKRPNSVAVASDWNVSSSNEEKIKILDTYSTPKDSKQQLSPEDAEQKCFTSPDREYSQPYTTDGSSGPTSDEEFFGHQITVSQPPLELNSPDSIAEAILPLVNVQSPISSDIKRHPSPYYYSDLYKARVVDSPSRPTTSKQSATIVSSRSEYQRNANNAQDHRKTQKSWSGYHKKYRKNAVVESKPIRGRPEEAQIISSDDLHERLNSPCACVGPEDVLEDDMTRQRHVYETAFDCRISKSDDDLDQIDKVSNHPVLVHFDNTKQQSAALEARRRSSGFAAKADDSSVSGVSRKLENMHLPAEGSCTIAAMPLRGYTPSPPSTAPLPTKFHGKELIMSSIRSAPNLPSHSKSRLKNLHLPIKSFRTSRSPSNSSTSVYDIQHSSNTQLRTDKLAEPAAHMEKDTRVMEIKDRPRKDLLLFKRSKDGKGTILEFKVRRRRHKYSSTESMTTSSSGGSMESIKSSTSEGNRSTTSTDSRNSSSLSSHDSDSGAASNFLAAQGTSFHIQSNKLHILSPISDKSSQEPVSEISDNNRNNNSQKCSPEEIVSVIETKTRRRLPQNKNLLNLGFHSGDPEIQGSDSGISIQSREGIKSRFGLAAEISGPSQTDFSDLPFDMPKLRRRRVAVQEACTSGSATSIDFGELPFDMPKLRRRLRVQQFSKEPCVSQASSSQSVMEQDAQALHFRPKLTLNLADMGTKQKSGLGLSLLGMGLHLNSSKSPTSSHEFIDMNLPLEKQGWFHGAITRVEAENVLRLLREGSFLVRNSESTKQDYSLSLKSVRGFMHMRIQRDDANAYILGQFSKPFNSIPEMIRHFSLNGLPIRGAEHMCLIQPVIAQLL